MRTVIFSALSFLRILPLEQRCVQVQALQPGLPGPSLSENWASAPQKKPRPCPQEGGPGSQLPEASTDAAAGARGSGPVLQDRRGQPWRGVLSHSGPDLRGRFPGAAPRGPCTGQAPDAQQALTTWAPRWPFLGPSSTIGGFPGGCSRSEPACRCRRCKRRSFDPGLGRSPGEVIGYPLQYSWAPLVVQTLKNPPAMRKTWVRSLG